MTVSTGVVKLFLQDETLVHMPLESGLRLQILPSISALPDCQKHQFAAFVRTYNVLIVWDDDPNHILKRVQSIEEQLIRMVWKEEFDDDGGAPPALSAVPSTLNLHPGDQETSSQNPETILPPRRIVLVQPIITAVTLILLI